MNSANQTDVTELPAIVAEGAFMYLALARQLLAADLSVVAGIDASTRRRAALLQNSGWRLGLEIYVDESKRVTIALAAVSADGRHQTLRAVKEEARGNAQ